LRLFSNSMYDLMYNKYTKINKLKSINNHALQIHAEKKGGGRTTTKNTEMRKKHNRVFALEYIDQHTSGNRKMMENGMK